MTDESQAASGLQATSDSGGQTAESAGIDDLIERLRGRVAERRASGDYPEGLEDELEAHFRRIVFHRTYSEIDQVQIDIDAIDSHMDFGVREVLPDSRIPGGELFHKALTKALARQNEILHDQLQGFAEAVRRALHTLALAVKDPSSHTHGDLIGHIDAILERLDSYERQPITTEAGLGDLRRRVEELERAEAARKFDPWFTNDAFEERFRGSKEHLLASYKDLADEFIGFGPVLDFGCGRGEFMQLLNERGIECRGVEIDPKLAEAATADGLSVETGDGLKVLAAQDDSSLGGIVLLQVIEHLTIGQQLDLVRLAHEKLRPGGKIIVETVNPKSLYVYAHSFYLDPTHTRPVHPAYLEFLFAEKGFSEVSWDGRNPPPESDRLTPLPENGPDENNRNIERLNLLLFSDGDYALTAIK